MIVFSDVFVAGDKDILSSTKKAPVGLLSEPPETMEAEQT
jgi:hypothetical protein